MLVIWCFIRTKFIWNNCACDSYLPKHKRAITGSMCWMYQYFQLLWRHNATKIKPLGKVLIKTETSL